MVANCLPVFTVPKSVDGGEQSGATRSNVYVEREEETTDQPEAADVVQTDNKTEDWVQFSESFPPQNGVSVISEQLDTSPSPLSPVPSSLTNSFTIPSSEAIFEDNFAPQTGDIFSLVDPFSQKAAAGIEDNDLLKSKRDHVFDMAYKQAVGGKVGDDRGGGGDSDDDGLDDLPSPNEFAVNYVSDIHVVKNRGGSVSFMGPHHKGTQDQTIDDDPPTVANSPHSTGHSNETLLPPPPPTVVPNYVERGGWALKLSHRKG